MHGLIKSMIEKRFLEICTPEMAYAWLRDQPPVKGFYRNRFTRIGEAGDHEKALLDRSDPLIDYALARYGRSGEVAEALYARLGHVDRCVMRACHLSGGGPETFNIVGEIASEAREEIKCWVTNPNIGDDAFLALFSREGVFEKVSDDQWMNLLQWAGTNQRLATPYESTFLDGWDEHRYREVFNKAWKVAETVPVTQEWAGALNALLTSVVPVTYDLDVPSVLERWRIDAPEDDSKAWHSKSRSWYLRTHLARLADASEAQASSGDAAIRAAFYGRFNPNSFPQWPAYLKKDGELFFQYAVYNEMLWRTAVDREKLSAVAWSVPDPRSNMDAPNLFRGFETRMRMQHPDWFTEV